MNKSHRKLKAANTHEAGKHEHEHEEIDQIGDWRTLAPISVITKERGTYIFLTDMVCKCPYLPDTPCGAAILLIPGGSYGGIYPRQGEPFARWLNEQGIAAFVLRYRLGSTGYRYPSQHQDAVAPPAFFRNRRRQSPNTHLSQFP